MRLKRSYEWIWNRKTCEKTVAVIGKMWLLEINGLQFSPKFRSTSQMKIKNYSMDFWFINIITSKRMRKCNEFFLDHSNCIQFGLFFLCEQSQKGKIIINCIKSTQKLIILNEKLNVKSTIIIINSSFIIFSHCNIPSVCERFTFMTISEPGNRLCGVQFDDSIWAFNYLFRLHNVQRL